MKLKTYEQDAYLTELSTEVLEIGRQGPHVVAVTADSIFYPEGGGQPSDRGTIAGSSVLDVKKTDNVIHHLLESEVEIGPAQMKLDWARRFDHMQQHTGQHLLTAIAADRFGWNTTAFHLGERVSDVELNAPDLGANELESIEEAVNTEILNGRAVKALTVSRSEYEGLPVRSRGLPDGHVGDIRLVEIDGLDLNTCGGTHLRSTAELGCLCLLGTERLRGGTRVVFAAGNRIRRMVADHEHRTARLRQILDASNEALIDQAERREMQIRTVSKRLKGALNELAHFESRRLASVSQPLIEAHWDDRDMSFLQAVARNLAVCAPSTAALLTAGKDADGAFLLAAGPESDVDVSRHGPAVAAIVEGRGGGRGKIFQGKATRIDRRSEAIDLLRNQL